MDLNIIFNAYDLAEQYASMMEAGYKMAQAKEPFDKNSVKLGLLDIILEGIEKRKRTKQKLFDLTI